jgi:acetylornithine deacetylase/succinyl-diaminopimelate desuccinylase-like protein
VAGKGTVGTVGEIEVDPGIINAIASRVRFSLDIRGPDDEAYRSVAREITAFAEDAARRRGMRAESTQRQTLPATPMDARIVDALEAAAAATGEPYMNMHSGARTTRCASPTASPRRWYSCRARTGLATIPRSSPTRTTPRSRPRSS